MANSSNNKPLNTQIKTVTIIVTLKDNSQPSAVQKLRQHMSEVAKTAFQGCEVELVIHREESTKSNDQ